MNKQRKTYLLLAVVVVIWGLIGYKVINTLSPEPEAPTLHQKTAFVPETKIKRDTFTLHANYRDPFLGTIPKPKGKVKKMASKKTDVPKKSISYSGLVSKSGSGSRLFFVTIDGHQHIMSLKQEVDGVRLLSGKANSIRIDNNGVTETVTLSE